MQWDVQDPIGESAFVSGRCQKVRLLQSGKNPRRDATPPNTRRQWRELGAQYCQ